jgi:hypothetical protein
VPGSMLWGTLSTASNSPMMPMPSHTTGRLGGTMMSTPPQTAKAFTSVMPGGSSASRKSRVVPPNTAMALTRRAGAQRAFRSAPPRRASTVCFSRRDATSAVTAGSAASGWAVSSAGGASVATGSAGPMSSMSGTTASVVSARCAASNLASKSSKPMTSCATASQRRSITSSRRSRRATRLG